MPPAKSKNEKKPETLVVLLGNPNPQMQRTERVITADGQTVERTVSVPADHLTQSVTRVELWDGIHDDEFVNRSLSTDNDRVLKGVAAQLTPKQRKYAIAVHEIDQLMQVHSAGVAPKWVDSENKDLAHAVAAFYNCDVGEPTNLLVNGGRDQLHAAAWGTSAQPAAGNYMALTANSTAAAATDTSLTGEITTAGGGLVRAQATWAHTAGTNTTTLTKTFTANGSDSLPVTVAKIGIFNASSSGTMCFETALSSSATLSVSGDNVTVTETITAG